MKKRKIIAIIPARIGSKRLHQKNIYNLNGKPLICWTIDEALKSEKIDNIYISTESEEIFNTLHTYYSDNALYKNKVVDWIKRPIELADDTTWTQPVIDHMLKFVSLENDDLIVILQANSPQITVNAIDSCIDKVLTYNLWELNTVDKNLINNGAIQIIRKKVCTHVGKANYNGVFITDWIDVHTIEDIEKVKEELWKGF